MSRYEAKADQYESYADRILAQRCQAMSRRQVELTPTSINFELEFRRPRSIVFQHCE